MAGRKIELRSKLTQAQDRSWQERVFDEALADGSLRIRFATGAELEQLRHAAERRRKEVRAAPRISYEAST